MANTSDIDLALLQKFSRLVEGAAKTPDDLSTQVASHEQDQARPWLRLTEQDWQPALNQLPVSSLLPLAVFFTLAEQQLSGWQCGARNPAIWIFRWLRQNQQLPDKEQIRQLKKLTDNRFIPYGSVL